jgi:pseudomonalisin
LAVLGLQTVDHPGTFIVRAPASGAGLNPSGTPGALQGYDPTAFPLIYSANTLPTGSAANVGIVSEGDLSQVLSDLQNFESKYGLPILSPSVVNVGSPSGDQSNNAEWDLDSQTIQAMAGGSLQSLTFYVAPSLSDSNLAAVYSRIVSVDTAKIINASLGECEATAHNNGALATDDQTFLSAVAQGQTFSFSTGDNGSRTCGAPGNGQYGTTISVSYPASSSYVVAVGGTTLYTNGDGTWASETAWSYSGGGISAYEQPTQWTQGITSVPTAVRGIPDVAMDADPNSGAYVYLNGVYRTGPWGGTSLASPLFVGAWARIETAQGNVFGYPNPIMYAQSVPIAAFHDITSGNNDDYNAAPNWDYTTGWGTLIASTLSTNLAALPTPPTSVTDANAGYACPSDFISWSAVSGASSYQLYGKQTLPSQDLLFGLVWSGAGTSTTVTLGQGQQYVYTAKACTSDGCSQISTSQITVTEGTCP